MTNHPATVFSLSVARSAPSFRDAFQKLKMGHVPMELLPKLPMNGFDSRSLALYEEFAYPGRHCHLVAGRKEPLPREKLRKSTDPGSDHGQFIMEGLNHDQRDTLEYRGEDHRVHRRVHDIGAGLPRQGLDQSGKPEIPDHCFRL